MWYVGVQGSSDSGPSRGFRNVTFVRLLSALRWLATLQDARGGGTMLACSTALDYAASAAGLQQAVLEWSAGQPTSKRGKPSSSLFAIMMP